MPDRSPTLICAACGAENRADRRFCRQCDSTLANACGVCGATNEPGDRFCGSCGTTLVEPNVGAATPAVSTSPTTERRLVSVLFLDLVGFTAQSEARDPEEARAIIDQLGARTLGNLLDRVAPPVESSIGVS